MRRAYQARNPGEKFKDLTLNLPEPLIEKIREQAQKSGVSMSRFVREVLEEKLGRGTR